MLPPTRRLMNGKNGIYVVFVYMTTWTAMNSTRTKRTRITEKKAHRIINLLTRTRNGEMTVSNEEKLAKRCVGAFAYMQRVVDPTRIQNQMNVVHRVGTIWNDNNNKKQKRN